MNTPVRIPIHPATPERPVKKRRSMVYVGNYANNYTGNHLKPKNLFGDFEEESRYMSPPRSNIIRKVYPKKPNKKRGISLFPQI
jgi:hypothetical protein